MIENRAVGIKSREVYEAPAAIVLIQAHSALEDVVLTKDEARIKRGLEQRWTELVYEGLWFSPAREAIDAFVDTTQALVEGDVRVVAAAERRRRHRPALAEHALRRDSSRPTAPARRSPTRPRRASSRSRRSRSSSRLPASGRRRTHDPLVRAGSGARSTRPWPRSSAPTTPSCCRTTARRRPCTPAACTPQGCSTTTSWPRPSRGCAEIATGGGIEPDDEDVHTRDRAAARRRRPEDPRGQVAQRPGRGGVPALRRRCEPARRGPAIAELAGGALDRAEADAETPMPGYTHLQRAQPVTVGHHLLAWVEMLERDLTRFAAAADGRAEPSPLGAGALAGSTLPLPAPERTAPQLARRRRRPRLRARLPLRGSRLLRPPLPNRRGARALDDGGVRLRPARRGRRHRARR